MDRSETARLKVRRLPIIELKCRLESVGRSSKHWGHCLQEVKKRASDKGLAHSAEGRRKVKEAQAILAKHEKKEES